MPPFIQVQSLYASCLESVFESLYTAVQKAPDLIEPLRYFIQLSLHAGIREHLIQIATVHCSNDIFLLLDLLTVLMDKAIRKIDHSKVNDSLLRMDQCASLYSSLEQCNATGLHELTLKVGLDPKKVNHLESVSAANITFHRVLRNGLASSLHTLVLRSVCDNEILRLLGQNCKHLRYLDVTSSWLVDDGGLKQLCFKDPDSAASYFGTHLHTKVEASSLNSCCRTLQEVRIQDTNTSEVGVAILLLFFPHLKSLGGFIYYRNVGDAILSLQSTRPELQLSLTDLWDTSLPPEKAELLSKSVPHLSSLYTRGSWLASLTHFSAISSITVDFDFVDFSHLLEDYLFFGGTLLKKLVIVDQNHPIDLIMLAELCPSLEQLGAKLKESWSGCISSPNFLPCLVTARIRVASTKPFISLLAHAQNLQHLEVSLQEDIYGEGIDLFDDFVISEALSKFHGPRALTTFLMNSECFFSIVAVRMLLEGCPLLQQVGELQLWIGVHERDLEELAAEMRQSNYNISFRYRGKWFPYKHHCYSVAQTLL